MTKKHSARVRYMGELKRIKVRPESTLLENLVKAKIPIGRSCDGEGICTTCRIFIKKGEVSDPENLEQERRLERNFADNERLACQCRVVSEHVELEVP